jgi:hypothetical protein
VLCPRLCRVIAVRRWRRPGWGLAWGSRSESLQKGGGYGTIRMLPFSPGVMNASYIASSHRRPSVRGEEREPTVGEPVCAEHSRSKGVNLEKQAQTLRCECRAYGRNGSGRVCRKRRPLGYQATSQLYCSLTKYAGSAWWTEFFYILLGPGWRKPILIQNLRSAL